MRKYPKIGQYRNAIKTLTHHAQFDGTDKNGDPIYDHTIKLPVVNYQGTVKLHGTNASVVLDEELEIQSRNNIITPENDNAGFATFVYSNHAQVLEILHGLRRKYGEGVVAVYGEWCGGNIQGGVVLRELDKMFVIFSVKIGDKWLSHDQIKDIHLNEAKIFNIYQFPVYNIAIDFNKPEQYVNELAEITTKVELECPVGVHFGKAGTGEGVVWKPIDDRWNSSDYWFKVKGEKHQASKVKTLAPIDIERLNSMKELVDSLVTDSRLKQGLDYLKEQGLEVDRKNLGRFIKWVSDDVVTEETDTIVENGFKPKEVTKEISNKARKWFFSVENF